MGAGCSIPEEQLKDLIETTKFKRAELKRWYRKFRHDYPSGLLDKQNFFDLFGTIATTEKSAAADHIFRLFDHDHDGLVNFTELMSTLSVTTAGSIKEKMEWIFDVYDVDSDGAVTLEELIKVVSCMQGVSKRRNESTKLLSEDVLETVFAEADSNDNGKLTLDEFIGATHKLPELIKMLHT